MTDARTQGDHGPEATGGPPDREATEVTEPPGEGTQQPAEGTQGAAEGEEPGGSGQQILVIVLDKPSRASELLLTLTNLASEGKVRIHDAVIVAKDAGGKSRVVQTIDVTPMRGALAGTWWGMLGGLLVGGPVFLATALGGAAAGALYGKLVDHGLDDGWVKEMAEWVQPDRSALLLLVDSGFDDAAVVAELRRFECIGQVAYTTLPQAARDEIERALSGTRD